MLVTNQLPLRTPRQEALATGVRLASQAAVQALHAAADDRRFIHEQEWGQTAHDTLADIDEFADTLQGFASWVVGGTSHPQLDRVLSTLRQLDTTTFDLCAILQDKQQRCLKVQDYLGRLEDLRLALLEYFSYAVQSIIQAPESASGTNAPRIAAPRLAAAAIERGGAMTRLGRLLWFTAGGISFAAGNSGRTSDSRPASKVH